MIKKVNDALFNTHVIPSDWRYSAAIVGLEKYLYNQNLEYEIKDEYFAFNQEDITRERFLEFAEELRAAGYEAIGVRTDVTDKESVLKDWKFN